METDAMKIARLERENRSLKQRLDSTRNSLKTARERYIQAEAKLDKAIRVLGGL